MPVSLALVVEMPFRASIAMAWHGRVGSSLIAARGPGMVRAIHR